MHLVENDQPVLVLGEIEFRLGESGAVCIGLEVEIDGRAPFAYGERKRRLADLPWPDESDGGHAVEQFAEIGGYSALYHPCIYGVQFHNCKDNCSSEFAVADESDGVEPIHHQEKLVALTAVQGREHR
jgi:hypothetical protein